MHLSAGHVDHAIWPANYAMRPFEARKVAVLCDGSGPSRALAEAFERNRALGHESGGVHEVPDDVEACGALLAKLAAGDGVDFAFVCGGLGAAARVAEAARAAGEGAEGRTSTDVAAVPDLLFMDGLATPGLIAAAPASARFLEGTIPLAEREMLGRFRRRREEAGEPASPLAEKGFVAGELLVRAFRANGLDDRDLVQRLRGWPDPVWRNTPLTTEWGQTKLFEYFLYEAKDGAPARSRPLYLWSHTGGTLLRYRDPQSYEPDPDGIVVVLGWGDEETATIDDNLKRLGLSTGGYERPMDEWVKQELLARCLAYLNRLYWRNADGTPIPGVSFDIGFGLDVPEEAKRHKVWKVTIAGDDPAAGGRAFPPNRAFTYATFLERTMYRKHALTPKLDTPDVAYFSGRYEWGSSKEGNQRHDAIRSLINGYAGAMALTTAHECGHLGGLGHDTVTKRSIMNVEDAKGLDPESGEWIPDHVEILERSIDREPEPRRRR